MAEQAPLTVDCIDFPADKAELRDYGSMPMRRSPGGALRLSIFTTESSACVYIDEARARQMFNWLGVWLHTPRP